MKKQHKLLVLSMEYEKYKVLLLMRDHCAHMLAYCDHLYEQTVKHELQVLQH